VYNTPETSKEEQFMIAPVVLPHPTTTTTTTTTTTITTVTVKTPRKFNQAGTQGTSITMMIDESGSMGVVRNSTIAGFNEFVQAQRASESAAGVGHLTLVTFASGKVGTVYHNRPLTEVPVLDASAYQPAGGTNLLDAIGDTITAVDAVLAQKEQAGRPGVIVTIMTDGEENSSQRYTNQQIKDMVAAAEQADWTFQFLGANIDAFSVGSTFGMNPANSVNYNTDSMAATFGAVSASTTRMRVDKSQGLTTAEIYHNGLYTSQELDNMNTKN
jgi:hypothetical protein